MKKELILIFLVLFVSGCNQSEKEFPFSYKKMDYSVSEPDEIRGVDYVGFAFEGKNIFLDQRINYDCCADMSLNYRIDNSILRIYENNDNEDLCGRTCTFVIKAKVKEKNIDEVEIYGVKHKNWPYTFLSEKKR